MEEADSDECVLCSLGLYGKNLCQINEAQGSLWSKKPIQITF